MEHDLQYDSESTTDVLYRCSICQRLIGFNKEGVGTPYVAADLVPPTNPEEWMGPCTI